MNGIQELTYPPFDFSFKTTDDLKCLDGLVGQERGKKAMEFGLLVEAEGYNIYISGQPGTGRTTLAKDYTQKVANQKPVPSDWCYVYNFRDKRVPKALGFDSGDGKRFQNDMIELIEYLTKEIPYIYTEANHQKQKAHLLEACDQEKDPHLKAIKLQQIKDLEYQMGLENIAYYIKILKEKYVHYEAVVSYLDDLQEDILDHIEVFINYEAGIKALVSKYGVNLLVDHGESTGAPVIVGITPTYTELLGRESTNYMEVKPGLFHQANGGYLILEAEDTLGNTRIWNLIRKVLKRRRLNSEIPMNLKLILIGSPDLYDLAYEDKLDFKKYFKVKVNLKLEIDSSQANMTQLARFIKTVCHDQLLLPFSQDGVKEVIRYAIGQAANKNRMTAEFAWIGDLVIEASVYASLGGAKLVEEKHVRQAVVERQYRK